MHRPPVAGQSTRACGLADRVHSTPLHPTAGGELPRLTSPTTVPRTSPFVRIDPQMR
jgi:hypothetical protein